MKWKWTKENRLMLEGLLKEGYKIPAVSKLLGVSVATIYNEIKKGVSEEEYGERRYLKYTAERAIEWEIRKIRGE